MIPYTGQLKNYSFDTERVVDKKNGKRVTNLYCNSILTFDIEVSSAWLENDKVIGYKKGETAEYWNNLQPLALPYIWQFSCDGVVYYGRELWDFEQVLKDIPSDLHCIIWIHNLAYEFQFLSNFLSWESVFARSSHKPMKCVPEQYPNIEFRCSYMLTRLSLETWGSQLGVLKASGDLDYEILRTPYTPLTEIEMHYCEQDCLVVEAGIKEYIKRYGTQRNIPLTQTGTVRLETKKRLMNNKKYCSKIKKLVPKNAKEYKMLQNIFAGGYTHANRWYAGEILKEHIEHYDFASSYPTVMVCEKYPSAPWVYTAEHKIPKDSKFENFAYIIHARFGQLNCISYNTYIQASKAICTRAKYDNGRVISADTLEMWFTEQDWLTIKNNYEWKDVEVIHLYESRKDYLPKAFTEYILELYANKTELKEAKGEETPEQKQKREELYLQSKQYINSLYGMSVTAIVQANIVLNGDEWITEPLTEETVNEKLKSLRYPNPREKRYFLSYSWGCWVTAYARRNLWKCIEKCDKDLIYCDTDSIFVRGKHDFSWYNEEVTKKIKTACDIMELDFNKTHPKTPKGKEKPLGVFASEDNCTEFITLGAKRYVERREKDGQLHLTVSGINKDAVELLHNDIANFKDGFDFDKDADCVTKRLSTYVYDMPVSVWQDGYISKYTHGINLRRTGYNLTMTDEYKELINYYNMTVDELPEQFMVSMRGRFTV